MLLEYILIYLLAINIISFIIAAIDKLLAKKQMRRVSEKALFTLAFLGGALFMYASMRIFHHKTLHKRFMIGLPIIYILQMIVFALYLLTNQY